MWLHVFLTLTLAVSLASLPFFFLSSKRLRAHQSWNGRSEEQTYLSRLLRIEPRFLGRPARTLVTTSTELSQLLKVTWRVIRNNNNNNNNEQGWSRCRLICCPPFSWSIYVPSAGRNVSTHTKLRTRVSSVLNKCGTHLNLLCTVLLCTLYCTIHCFC